MKDGDVLAPRHLSGKAGGVQFPAKCGESDQVVNDDMHRAADAVAGKISIVQRLRKDSLPSEGAIAVYHQRQILSASALAGAVLLGAAAADGHRIHRLEMAGIRNQMDVDPGAGASHILSRRAHVVLHVAATQHAARVYILESAEDLLRRPPGDLHNHVQPPAVAHAHHQFDGAPFSGRLQNLIDQRDQRGYAFERKAFGAEIALL